MAGRSVAGGLAPVARDVLARAQQAQPAAAWSPRDVVDRALAAVSETKQAWSRSALVRAISDALPGNLRVAPEQVEPLLEGLTDAALEQANRVTAADDTTNLPASELLANGQSPYTSPTGALYTTDGQFTAEHAVRAAAVRPRGRDAAGARSPTGCSTGTPRPGVTLGDDQAAALRGVLTSGAQVEVLWPPPGPASRSSSARSPTPGATVTRTPARPTRTRATTGRARGCSGSRPTRSPPTSSAARASTARNMASWLAAQRRLDHPGSPAGENPHGTPGGDEPWRLRRDDLVVVDEAGTADTTSLAEIVARCQAAGAKLLLVGDPRQLAAVGPGGALADVAEHGLVYQLAEVRRFANDWEGPASLRLRDGDVSVLDEYAKHGRLVDGGTAEQAEAAAARGWLADTLAGQGVAADGRHQRRRRAGVGAAAGRARRARPRRRARRRAGHARAGRASPPGWATWSRPGRTAWHLRQFEGNTAAPMNRQTYRVTALRPDGGLTVAPIVERRGHRRRRRGGGVERVG